MKSLHSCLSARVFSHYHPVPSFKVMFFLLSISLDRMCGECNGYLTQNEKSDLFEFQSGSLHSLTFKYSFERYKCTSYPPPSYGLINRTFIIRSLLSPKMYYYPKITCKYLTSRKKKQTIEYSTYNRVLFYYSIC